MNDVKDDYDYARSKYYNLAEKGDEAIELMLELARDSEHPRAFEVLSNMMKQNAEIADRLMELQKKKKEVNTHVGSFPVIPTKIIGKMNKLRFARVWPSPVKKLCI